MQIAESPAFYQISLFYTFLVEGAYFKNHYDDVFSCSGHSLLFCVGWIISLFFLVGFNFFLLHLKGIMRPSEEKEI